MKNIIINPCRVILKLYKYWFSTVIIRTPVPNNPKRNIKDVSEPINPGINANP